MMTKPCRRCKNTYPATSEYFTIAKHVKSGITSYCRECERVRKTEYRKLHIDQCREIVRKYHNEHKQERKDRYEKNKEKILTQCKEYYNNNKREAISIRKQYKKLNKDKISSYKRKYMNKIKSLPNTLSLVDWQYCQQFFNNRCAYCGKDNVRLEKEHFIPASKNGPLSKSNILPSCAQCNSSKQETDFEEWYKKQTFYSHERQFYILLYLSLMKREESTNAKPPFKALREAGMQ